MFLAEAFGSMDGIAGASLEQLQMAEEVGPKVAETVFQFFREPRNRELVERLRAAGLQFMHELRRRLSGPLHGLDLCSDRHAAQSEPGGRRSPH